MGQESCDSRPEISRGPSNPAYHTARESYILSCPGRRRDFTNITYQKEKRNWFRYLISLSLDLRLRIKHSRSNSFVVVVVVIGQTQHDQTKHQMMMMHH